MTPRRATSLTAVLGALLVVLTLADPGGAKAAAALPPPGQFIGFPVGADNKLARWDSIVEYMKLAAATSDRVRYRELGPSTNGNPLIVLEISAPETLQHLDRYKEMERRLYFQGGAPDARERDEIFREGKVVILVTCGVHANEVGATQMSLELVHRLATDDSPATRKILDNVILLLVPSLNPDGQILITDWFNRNLGTPYATSPLPYLYHPYAGHDNNRDMYMFTQKESQYAAQLAWQDWFPTVWLDEHQMGQTGARIFVMPATDPINPNVHPLIYRWNTILGQSQAAALEAAGKQGIIYNSTYTNFWQGAMAWSGWWHNQIGLLTEVASVRIAAPTDQRRPSDQPPPEPPLPLPMFLRDRAAAANSGRGGTPLSPRADEPSAASASSGGGARTDSTNTGGGTAPGTSDAGPLPAPTDITPRTEYPRPWLGGHWTLRDIVDYELIATMGLLETGADRREAILRQIYEVNRQTIDEGRNGDVSAIVIPIDNQQDPRESAHLVDRLDMAGVEVYRAEGSFEAGGHRYGAGAFVIPMTQVFARYARDLLEKQTYPEVRRGANSAAEPPYDVTAWSLGMLFGVRVDFIRAPSVMPASVKLARVKGLPKMPGRLAGNGTTFTFPYKGADTAIAINRLLKEGAAVSFDSSSRVWVTNVARDRMDGLARDFGLSAAAEPVANRAGSAAKPLTIKAPRVALYAPWTGGNMDEGWTRWVLEQYEFHVTTVHNDDLRTPGLRARFDAIVLPDQNPRDIIDGFTSPNIRPEYRGGIGEAGVENIHAFVGAGGTLITLGIASDLAIDRLPIPVRNIKRGLRRDEHFAPGAILRIQVDTSHPVGYGTAADTYAFYNNSPFFSLVEGFTSQKTTVVARYPNQDVTASGWLKGEELMMGRAAVVSIEMNPGRVVLFGLRPQHRAQTHATFPMLFNALYLSTIESLAAAP